MRVDLADLGVTFAQIESIDASGDGVRTDGWLFDGTWTINATVDERAVR